MEQEQYLKNRLQKALRIADELNYMIEHTLVPLQGKIELALDESGLDLGTKESFQGKTLYDLFLNFLDYSFQMNEDGSYPDELVNSYLEDLDQFSLHPKVVGDVFEFKIQDHVYKIEVIMNGIVGMTLLINEEWIQTRIIKNTNDFSAVMRILDSVKGMYEINPYENKKEFIDFYNKVIKIADEEAIGWRDVEKKVFVPYSKVNDIYFSPYNSKQFFSDFFDEVELLETRLGEIKNKNSRELAKKYIEFLMRCKSNFSVSNSQELSDFLSTFSAGKVVDSKVFPFDFFQEFIRRISKKHNVLSRLKELAEELETFSDLKTVDEQNEEAEKEYGYEAVKKYLIDKDKNKFLTKAVLMTPIDSVNLSKYVALQSEAFIQERADILLEVVTREVLPLQADEIKKIASIIASDPINLIKKVVPESESFFNDKDIEFTPPSIEEVDKTMQELELAEKLFNEHEEEYSLDFRNTVAEVYEEMEKMQEEGKVEKKDFDEKGELSEYYKLVLEKSLEKLVESGVMDKIIKEVTKNED